MHWVGVAGYLTYEWSWGVCGWKDDMGPWGVLRIDSRFLCDGSCDALLVIVAMLGNCFRSGEVSQGRIEALSIRRKKVKCFDNDTRTMIGENSFTIPGMQCAAFPARAWDASNFVTMDMKLGSKEGSREYLSGRIGKMV